MKFINTLAISTLAASASAAAFEKRDACPADFFTMMKPIFAQVDFNKVDWKKVMADSQPLMDTFLPLIPKMMYDMGPIMNDLKPLWVNIDWAPGRSGAAAAPMAPAHA